MRKFIRIIGIFLLTIIGIVLVGCEGGENPPKEEIAPTELEIYIVGAKELSTYYYGDEINLAVDVEPYNASYDVKWTSSDKNIARVDENGKVSIVGGGSFTITATSNVDSSVSATWSKTAYDNRGDLSNIDEAKAYLDYLIPEGYQASGVLTLPSELSGTTISWSSSNTQVLSTNGIFCRQEEDVTVTLKARIVSGRSVGEWERDVLVGNINDMKMKTLYSGRIVMMYVYSNMHPYTPYELENVDIINHAFALIDPTTHKLKLSGIENSVREIIKARSYGIRVCLSIGGWGADGFSQACATAETREVFIQSIIDAVQKYGYDGVDLDWEYPGSDAARIAKSSSDKANFTVLVKELRAALNKINSKLLLTAAVASDTTYYNVPEVDKYLDYWNLMTYDFSYKETGSRARYDESLPDTKQSVEAYINAKATPEKMILGVTFRATKFAVESLGSTYGVGQTMQLDRVDIDYKNIIKSYVNDTNYKYYYDSKNGMAIRYTPNKVDGYYMVVTYNDESSISSKASLAKSKKLGGMMAWDLSMDSTNNEALKMVVGSIK